MKNTKRLLTVICAVLLVAVSVAGTMAYMTFTTDKVTNTFVSGQLIDDEKDAFVLKEHEAKANDAGVYTLDKTKEVTSNPYTVLPGVDIPKDPFVRTDPSQKLLLDAYVFVEVVEDKFGTELGYAVDTDNWTEVSGAKGQHGGKVYALKANNGIANTDRTAYRAHTAPYGAAYHARSEPGTQSRPRKQGSYSCSSPDSCSYGSTAQDRR